MKAVLYIFAETMGEEQWSVWYLWRPRGRPPAPRRERHVRQQHHRENLHRGRLRQHHGRGGEQYARILRVQAV